MPARRRLLLAAACLLCAAAAADGVPAESAEGCSTQLTAKNFESSIKGKFAFVVFFAPWCGHCKALHPQFEKVCEDLRDEEDFLPAVVDAIEEEDLAQHHGVTGFPTILWYAKREFSVGKGEDYSGSRSEAAMLDFINSKTGWGVAPGGGLSSKAGRVKSMDKLVKEWVAHARLPEALIKEARKEVLSRARAEHDRLFLEGEKLDAKTCRQRRQNARLRSGTAVQQELFLAVAIPRDGGNVANFTAVRPSRYIMVMDKMLDDQDYIRMEQARLRRLLHHGQAQMSKAKARVLGRRLNVLRVFDHYDAKLPGNAKAEQTTHTIYTREQLLRFPPDELIEMVLELQEKGCDADEEDEPEVSGADMPHVTGLRRGDDQPAGGARQKPKVTQIVDLSEDEPQIVKMEL